MQNEIVTKDLTTTSLALAELFGKRHNDVLRTIRNIIKDMDSDTLSTRKIAHSSYTGKDNATMPMFILGEEMTLVITGRFTGKEALKAQMKLADAFIAMRDFIRNQQTETLRITNTQMSALIEKRKFESISDDCMKAIAKERNNNKVGELNKMMADVGWIDRTLKYRPYWHYDLNDESKRLNTAISFKGSRFKRDPSYFLQINNMLMDKLQYIFMLFASIASYYLASCC